MPLPKARSKGRIWEEKIFVTSADKEASPFTVLSVRTSDGEALWEKTYPVNPRRVTALNSQASSTPAVDADGVYIVSYGAEHTFVSALDFEGEDRVD